MRRRTRPAARYPFPNTTDFSSFLKRWMASAVQVPSLMNAGNDTVNGVKQAAEFDLNQRNPRLEH